MKRLPEDKATPLYYISQICSALRGIEPLSRNDTGVTVQL